MRKSERTWIEVELGRERVCPEADSQHTSGDKEITLSQNSVQERCSVQVCTIVLGRLSYILLYGDLNT